MPFMKKLCADCPFRKDGQGIELPQARLRSIVVGTRSTPPSTFVCHKTLDAKRKTCAGVMGVNRNDGHDPFIVRAGLALGVLTNERVASWAAEALGPTEVGL